MKKSFFSLKWTFSFLIVAGFLFAACNKSHSDNNNNTDVAGLMAFNLAPDRASVGISLSGNSITGTPLGYQSYTGGYFAIFPGTRSVDAFDFYSGTTFASASRNFEQNKYYSVFVVGAGGNYSNVIVDDNLDSLPSATGQAYIRYINAIPDSSSQLPTVTIAANGTNIINENAAFKNVSGFMPADAGDVSISITNGGAIDASRTITLEQNKIYTVLLTGIPGSTGNDKVEIKFIQNGTLDNAGGRTSSSAQSLITK